MIEIEKKLALTLLYDFYGELLTDKQKEVMDLHLIEDYGLVEIGEELSISRQAVYDKVKTSTKQLLEFEEKLGLVARYKERQVRLETLVQSVMALEKSKDVETIIEEIQAILSL